MGPSHRPGVPNLLAVADPIASGVASLKIWGGAKKFFEAKVFDFRRITLFCFEKRLSKHKTTIFSKNLGAWPLSPPLATPMPIAFIPINYGRQ